MMTDSVVVLPYVPWAPLIFEKPRPDWLSTVEQISVGKCVPVIRTEHHP